MVRAARLEVRERLERGNLMVWVEGELDLSTMATLEQRIEAQIGGGHTALVLDMSEVSFMDSSGLRFLIAINGRAEQEGWRISMIAPRHEPAKLVLRMTGADKALPFEQQGQP
jgi:anti-sigma B factor antagonist